MKPVRSLSELSADKVAVLRRVHRGDGMLTIGEVEPLMSCGLVQEGFGSPVLTYTGTRIFEAAAAERRAQG